MTLRKETPNLERLGREALAEVLEKLLRWRVTFPSTGTTLPPLGPGRIVANVALAGSGVSGGVWLHFPRSALARVVRELTGRDAAPVADDLLEDTAGELANMVAGCVARGLAQTGRGCQLGTPKILRTRRLRGRAARGTQQARIRAACADQRVVLEIEVRYRDS
jgi:CheY-specific phosphatase CheX